MSLLATGSKFFCRSKLKDQKSARLQQERLRTLLQDVTSSKSIQWIPSTKKPCEFYITTANLETKICEMKKSKLKTLFHYHIQFDIMSHSSDSVTSATQSSVTLTVDSITSNQTTHDFNGFSDNFQAESSISIEMDPELDPDVKLKQ